MEVKVIRNQPTAFWLPLIRVGINHTGTVAWIKIVINPGGKGGLVTRRNQLPSKEDYFRKYGLLCSEEIAV